jgi:hypothetical protein
MSRPVAEMPVFLAPSTPDLEDEFRLARPCGIAFALRLE